MNIAVQSLKADLDKFVKELARVSFLPAEQAIKALLAHERGSNLPDRIQRAILDGDCVLVERLVEDRWLYTLQSGDVEVSWIPSYLRSLVFRPIASQLTPVGDGSHLVWCCMD